MVHHVLIEGWRHPIMWRFVLTNQKDKDDGREEIFREIHVDLLLEMHRFFITGAKIGLTLSHNEVSCSCNEQENKKREDQAQFQFDMRYISLEEVSLV
jgi:hypothetical protein